MSRLSPLVSFAGKIGGYTLARRVTQRLPRILMYHRFSAVPKYGHTSANTFAEQVRFIKNRCVPLTMAELADAVFEKKSIPKHAVVITVDDGYRDFYEVAYPILKYYDVPATFFATTGFVDDRLWLWPDKITWLLAQCSSDAAWSAAEQALHPIDPLFQSRRGNLWTVLIQHLLSVPDAEKERLINLFATNLEISLPFSAPDGFRPISWEELAEVSQAGIEIGGHTVTHPSLGQVSRAQAEEEIYGCMTDLNAHLGKAKRTFCYPNGTPSDFQPFLPEIIASAGFVAASVAFPDALGTSDRYALRRHSSGEDTFQFRKAISGVEMLGHIMRKSVVMQPVS